MTGVTRVTRRALLAACVLAGCDAISGGGPVNSEQGSAGTLLKSRARLPQPFRAPLPIPPVLAPSRSDGGVDHYDIAQKPGTAKILEDLPTPIWGYNGIFPGPTIVSRSGRRTIVKHRNELPVPVSVHLHGGSTPPEHDGYPTDLVAAGGGRDYDYPLRQRAATLWYHDHRMDFTGPQVYRGLAGFHLVRDDHEESLGLPSGERDIPLMIADRSFDADGSFLYPSTDPSLTGHPGVTRDYVSGVLGDCVLVNGAAWPVLEVSAMRYRFRLLNASNARRYRLTLDPNPGFVQIGSDLGLLAQPLRHKTIDIAQGERFDVVVDFSGYSPGTEIIMRNTYGGGGTAQVMKFVVARRGRDDSRVPQRLSDLEPLPAGEATARRTIVFARGGAQAHGMTLWTVNGKAFSPDYLVAQPKLGAVERWTIRAQNVEHPFHLHLAPFQVVSPGPHQHGWKDTVNLGNGDRVDILVRFDGYRGKYVLHCHNLEHEDMAMMANFEVL